MLNNFQKSRVVTFSVGDDAAAKTVISELENGFYKAPSPASLAQLGAALELRTSDLFLLAGIPLPDDLPSLPVMLRTEYDLPPDAVDEVQRTIDRLARKYCRQQPNQDNQPNERTNHEGRNS